MICALAGGVGAARFLSGVVSVVPSDDVTIIGNTADDVTMHGLSISPDLDTVTYTLADAINPITGWGLVGETWEARGALARYEAVAPSGSDAGQSWFGLGDRDLATHMYRTQRLAEGAALSTVTGEIVRAWGLGVRLLPMSDDPVRTMVTLASGHEVGFQEYFVRLGHDVDVSAVRFDGASVSRPGPGVLDTLHDAARIIICPSNPIVSIGPILAVPGIRSALTARRDDVAAISPIIAGAALKGPADRMLATLGMEPSVVGVARIYAEIASTLVVDTADSRLASEVEACGMRCVVTPTVMSTPAIAAALAEAVVRA